MTGVREAPRPLLRIPPRLPCLQALGWRGKGATMKNGSDNSLGINKHCPDCGERHSFAKFSALVEDDAPGDWPPLC